MPVQPLDLGDHLRDVPAVNVGPVVQDRAPGQLREPDERARPRQGPRRSHQRRGRQRGEQLVADAMHRRPQRGRDDARVADQQHRHRRAVCQVDQVRGGPGAEPMGTQHDQLLDAFTGDPAGDRPPCQRGGDELLPAQQVHRPTQRGEHVVRQRGRAEGRGGGVHHHPAAAGIMTPQQLPGHRDVVRGVHEDGDPPGTGVSHRGRRASAGAGRSVSRSANAMSGCTVTSSWKGTGGVRTAKWQAIRSCSRTRRRRLRPVCW